MMNKSANSKGSAKLPLFIIIIDRRDKIMNLQKKFLTAVKNIAVNLDLDFIQNQSFSNVGTIQIMPKENFTTLLQFDYDFQNSWQNFSLSGDIKAIQVKYNDPGKIQEILDSIKDKLLFKLERS